MIGGRGGGGTARVAEDAGSEVETDDGPRLVQHGRPSAACIPVARKTHEVGPVIVAQDSKRTANSRQTIGLRQDKLGATRASRTRLLAADALDQGRIIRRRSQHDGHRHDHQEKAEPHVMSGRG